MTPALRFVLPLLFAGLLSATPASVSTTPDTVAPLLPFELATAPTPPNAIDAVVNAHLAARGRTPALPCSDAVFVRRVYLDVIGTLPTAAECRAFFADRDPQKRAALIDRLLAREEYADAWAMKWSDLLRIKAEFPVNLWPNAAQAYHRWVRTAIRDGMPYDQFARTLLTASGSNFRVGPVNFYRSTPSRDPAAIASSVALVLMATRTEHWTAPQLTSFAMCFRYLGFKTTGEWKEEIVHFDPDKFPPGGRTVAIFPDGTVAPLTRDRDPRETLADWLITPANPWFTRAIANRVWSWLLGRGVVHEPDDLRPDNPPSVPGLLPLLERELIAARYDLRALMRFILNSQTYQRSSIARDDAPETDPDFARYALRRLDAEVLIDALNQITGTSEKYISAIPEPFTFIPDDMRAIALPDGSITSSFLELFGRAARDTGFERERVSIISAPQRLHLLNSTHVQRKLEQGPKLQALLRARSPAREKVDTLFLTILSRPATAAEHRLAAERATNPVDARTASLDLAWALINSAEFLHRH